MIIGDERLGPLKDLVLERREDIIIMDSEGTPLQDVKAWLLQDENADILPTRLVYVMAGIWNLVTQREDAQVNTLEQDDGQELAQGIRLVTSNSPESDTPLLECEKQLTDIIVQVEHKYPNLKVIICPVIGIHIQGFNESKGVRRSIGLEVAEQQTLNDELIDLNNIIHRINSGRNVVTPRYDRNYFHYDCRTKSHRVYYPKLDKVSFFVSDAHFSKQVADKVCSSIEMNL